MIYNLYLINNNANTYKYWILNLQNSKKINGNILNCDFYKQASVMFFYFDVHDKNQKGNIKGFR
jgi:hypothetical protein